jgi:hypothetical protein
MRSWVKAGLLALLALLVTVGFQVLVVPQAMTPETPLEVDGVVQLAWWGLAGLTLILAARAVLELLAGRRQ